MCLLVLFLLQFLAVLRIVVSFFQPFFYVMPQTERYSTMPSPVLAMAHILVAIRCPDKARALHRLIYLWAVISE